MKFAFVCENCGEAVVSGSKFDIRVFRACDDDLGEFAFGKRDCCYRCAVSVSSALNSRRKGDENECKLTK